MATRKQHEANAHDALAEAKEYDAKARNAPEKDGIFSTSRSTWKGRADRARSKAHKEFAKARRARD